MAVKVNLNQCIGCGACVAVCPVLALRSKDTYVIIDEKKCVSCGICTKACPANALTLER